MGDKTKPKVESKDNVIYASVYRERTTHVLTLLMEIV